jgi:hypothetical protein
MVVNRIRERSLGRSILTASLTSIPNIRTKSNTGPLSSTPDYAYKNTSSNPKSNPKPRLNSNL